MGEVWLARDPARGEEAALKLLFPHALDAEQLLRFEREEQALRALRHPGIVAWLETGRSERGPWIAMELCPGGSLGRRVAAEGPLEPREAAEIARDLAAALAAVHEAGLLHRDLKPGNVLLDRDGRPRLADFGLARAVGRGESLTATGAVLGSPGYMAPEQVTGEKERLGPATDVYGLGATLYCLLSGAPPFAGPTALACLEAVLRDAPSPPSARRPGVPPGLDAIVLRCLARSPADRYPSAHALRASLEGWLAANQAAPRARGRARGRVLTGGLVVLGTVAFVAWRAPALPDAGPRPGPSAVLPLGAPPQPSVPREPLARAQALIAARDRWGALAELDRALARDPSSVLGHRLRGDVRAALGHLVQARADYERALELDPRDAWSHSGRGWVHQLLRLLPEARRDYDAALALDPGASFIWYWRGLVRRDQEDLAGALEDYSRALELDPMHVEARLNRANLLLRRQQPERALADFDRILARDPRHTLTLYNRARAHHALGQLEQAIADLDRALELEPDAPWSEVARARRARCVAEQAR